MKYITLMSFLHFLVYALSGIGLLGLFTYVYNLVTPYNDLEEIKKGNNASSITLSGAMIGFTIPLVLLSFLGVNLLDFALWSLVVGAIQIGLFKVLSMLLPLGTDPLTPSYRNTAVAMTYAALSICIGLIVGFSLIPS